MYRPFRFMAKEREQRVPNRALLISGLAVIWVLAFLLLTQAVRELIF